MSVSEFIKDKNFTKEIDLVLGLGYYLEFYAVINPFNSTDVIDLCKQGRCSLPGNITDALNKNTAKGYLMPVPEKKDSLNAYQLTNSGIKYIEEYIGGRKKA